MNKKFARILLYKDGKIQRRLVVRQNQSAPITIGKQGFGSIIDIEERFISRNHARIEVRETSELWIQDLDSTNGTFVNGEQITAQLLKDGDVITLGSKSVYKIAIEMLSPNEMIEEPSYTEQVDNDPKSTSSHKNREYLASDIINVLDPNSTGDLASMLRFKPEIVIGRSKECDIQLDQLTVTRKHAVILKKSEDSYIIKDLGSKNGTFVNGARIKPQIEISISKADDINIGAYKFRLGKPAEDIRKHKAIIVEGVTKTVNRGKITILRDISFQVDAQDFVAVMGPSGCGKSTLLRALNGDFPASEGRVFIHDMELYGNYDYLKRLIGYVPQDDIVHKELSVENSLYYAAKLRLSSDVSKEDIWEKINDVLTNLNINDPEIRKRKVGDLSGGQRKRVSIAVELLTDPSILFLDEPTSPLDPETIEDFLLCVKDLTKKGTTVMMVTHKPNDLYYVDKVIFLSKGGYMTYYGGKENYLSFFNAKNVIEVYSKNGTVEQGHLWAEKWKQTHQETDLGQTANQEIERRQDASMLSQFFWLTVRYFNIKTSDAANTLILLAQAPIIAGLIALIFEEVELSVLFLMSVSAIWFGTNNSAKEIVGELPIYRRERMFNLRTLPYIFSKIVVLTFFSAIQVLIFVAIIYYLVGTDALTFTAYWDNVFLMLYLCFSATLLGLLVSALVNNTEKVMTIIPIVLIPQIMLGGVMATIPSKSAVEFASYTMLSRWGTESFAYVQDSIRSYMALPTQPDSLVYRTVDAVEFLNLPNTLELAPELSSNLWAITVLNLVVFLGIVWALRRKDSV
ncbi:MAG: FHA domain-containing protein [Chitinophagales bacterium]